MADIKSILAEAVHRQASDVHINVGMHPIIRVNTELLETGFPIITNDDAKQIMISLVGQDKFNQFERKRDLDFSSKVGYEELPLDINDPRFAEKAVEELDRMIKGGLNVSPIVQGRGNH